MKKQMNENIKSTIKNIDDFITEQIRFRLYLPGVFNLCVPGLNIYLLLLSEFTPEGGATRRRAAGCRCWEVL